MPPHETKYLRQTAVLWPFVGVDRYNKELRGEPEEIKCRWVPTDKEGEAGDYSAKVVVAVDIAIRDLLWLGTYNEWLLAQETSDHHRIMRVIEFKKVPDIKKRYYRRTVQVKKYQGEIPEAVRVGTPSDVDLSILGAGFGPDACHGCNDLNQNYTVALTVNGLNSQEWRSDLFDLGTGTGTGSCDMEWIWIATRDLILNVVQVELYLTGIGVVATWAVEGEVWDGIEPLELTLLSSSAQCDWPATLTIQGIAYTVPLGDIVLVGAGFADSTLPAVVHCSGCTDLNQDFGFTFYGDTGTHRVWRTAPFTFDGEPHYWEVPVGENYVGVELRHAQYRNVRVVYSYHSGAARWDEETEITPTFIAGDSNCCSWPNFVVLRGN
jgi:hypothetical protein